MKYSNEWLTLKVKQRRLTGLAKEEFNQIINNPDVEKIKFEQFYEQKPYIMRQLQFYILIYILYLHEIVLY